MLEEHGCVIALDGAYVWVEPQRQGGGCGRCSAAGGCGTASLSKFFGQKPVRIRVLNVYAAQVGDTVRLGVAEDALLHAALRVYLLPLLSLFIFGIGYEAFATAGIVPNGEGYRVFSGLFGLGAALVWVKYSAEQGRYQPVMLEPVRPYLTGRSKPVITSVTIEKP